MVNGSMLKVGVPTGSGGDVENGAKISIHCLRGLMA
jgi:hypothetical protein